MDVYEFAMKMEKDGETFYRELALNAVSKGLKNILTMLADAEVVHYGIFRKMKENEEVLVQHSQILPNVRNVFEKMRDEKDTNVNMAQTELYRKAQEIEKASQNFYLKQGSEVKEPAQREAFLKIAEEENKHYFILERIIDFVSRPQTWLENPEWYHLEDY